MLNDQAEFFECTCCSDEHTLKVRLDEDPDYLEFYTTIYLTNYNSFIKRVWIAIKYIFGYKCKYGAWDCFTMKLEDADRMIQLCQRYKELAEKNKK